MNDVFHGSTHCPHNGGYRVQIWGEFTDETEKILNVFGFKKMPKSPLETSGQKVRCYLFVCRSYDEGLRALSNVILHLLPEVK